MTVRSELKLCGFYFGTFEDWDDWDDNGALFFNVQASPAFRAAVPRLPPDGFSLAFAPENDILAIFTTENDTGNPDLRIPITLSFSK